MVDLHSKFDKIRLDSPLHILRGIKLKITPHFATNPFCFQYLKNNDRAVYACLFGFWFNIRFKNSL